jgi:acyl-CoA thioesterase
MTTATRPRLQALVLDRSWWSYAGPHGGYIASRLLAAAMSLTDQRPRSLHVQFPAAAAEGTADLEAAIVRQGRSAAFVEASVRSGDATVARASVVLGGVRPGIDVPGLTPPPALYGALEVPVPVPTADLYVHFAGGASASTDPWALVRIGTSSAGDGWCVDDSEVWDRDGRLLASARQTRLVLGSAA